MQDMMSMFSQRMIKIKPFSINQKHYLIYVGLEAKKQFPYGRLGTFSWSKLCEELLSSKTMELSDNTQEHKSW